MAKSTRNSRLIDLVELMIVEQERYEDIKEEYDYVISVGDDLQGIDEILQESEDKVKGYQTWIALKNRPEAEVQECVDIIREFRKGNGTRMTGVGRCGAPATWTVDDIKVEYQRRHNAGLSVSSMQVQCAGGGLHLAGYRRLGSMDNICREAFGKTYKEMLELEGTKEEAKGPTRQRKYGKATGDTKVVKAKIGEHGELVDWMQERKGLGLSNERYELRRAGASKYERVIKITPYEDAIRTVYGDTIADNLKGSWNLSR